MISTLPKLTAFFTPFSPAEESNPLVLEKATSATSTAEAVEELSMSIAMTSLAINCDDSKCDESNL